MVGQRLSEQLGQTLVPENRPGAGSHLGIELAAKAKPDGYTIVLVAPEFTTGPSLYKKLNYDPLKDFAPISTVLATAAAVPHVQAGKVKALAVLSNERTPALPGVPTSREAGIDKWQVALWWGILAPAGTPREVIARLNAAWVKTAGLPETIEKMKNAGFEPLSGTPEQLGEFISAETARWAKVIKDANIVMVE